MYPIYILKDVPQYETSPSMVANLMRLSTVASLRHSLREEMIKILSPSPFTSVKNLSVYSRAGAFLSLIHPSKDVIFNFSPLVSQSKH